MTYEPKLMIEWLNQAMKREGWGVRETARNIGVSHPMISDIFNGERPSERTCIALAKGFKDDVDYLLYLGGYIELSTKHDRWIKAILEEGNALPDEEKLNVLEYIRFRRKAAGERSVKHSIRRPGKSESG